MEKQQTGADIAPKQQDGLTVLKVTTPNGVTSYLPYNALNKRFHEKKKRLCNKEKQQRYQIETLTLTWEEAAELGFSEAIQKITPPKKTAAQTTNETLAALLRQNAEMIAAITEKKGGKNG